MKILYPSTGSGRTEYVKKRWRHYTRPNNRNIHNRTDSTQRPSCRSYHSTRGPRPARKEGRPRSTEPARADNKLGAVDRGTHTWDTVPGEPPNSNQRRNVSSPTQSPP